MASRCAGGGVWRRSLASTPHWSFPAAMQSYPPANPEDGKVAERDIQTTLQDRLPIGIRPGRGPTRARSVILRLSRADRVEGRVGLSRVMLVAESRCHFGSFNLTTFDPDGRASLAQSLNDLPCANQPIAPSQCRFASKIMQLPSIFFRALHRPPPAQSLRRFRCASSSASTDGLETFMSYARLQSKERASQRN